jgi:DNA-directed RNA polymerase III subunit RPC1
MLALHPDIGRPEDYIWQYISVPPPAIRPSVSSDQGMNEDDLTSKLAEIVYENRMLYDVMSSGSGLERTASQWDLLQTNVALYINSQAPGMSAVGGKPSRGLVQRLKGKAGRFRGNLSGKRVDFSGRTVIGPDPNLRIDQVRLSSTSGRGHGCNGGDRIFSAGGAAERSRLTWQVAIPEKVAVKLSYPERVTTYNIELMRQCIINGVSAHPGANILEKPPRNGNPEIRFSLKAVRSKDMRIKHARGLEIGDVVHRHVRDGE